MLLCTTCVCGPRYLCGYRFVFYSFFSVSCCVLLLPLGGTMAVPCLGLIAIYLLVYCSATQLLRFGNGFMSSWYSHRPSRRCLLLFFCLHYCLLSSLVWAALTHGTVFRVFSYYICFCLAWMTVKTCFYLLCIFFNRAIKSFVSFVYEASYTGILLIC